MTDLDLDLKTFEKAVSDDPASAEAHANLGTLYSLGGKYKEAVTRLPP